VNIILLVDANFHGIRKISCVQQTYTEICGLIPGIVEEL